MENIDDILNRYAKEMEEDCTITLTNVMDKQLSAPNIKHKWLYRLAQNRRKLFKLREQKEEYLKNVSNPLKLSNKAIISKEEGAAAFKAIKNQIEEQENLIDYLETAIQKILSQLSFDIKNVIDLMKMEQL